MRQRVASLYQAFGTRICNNGIALLPHLNRYSPFRLLSSTFPDPDHASDLSFCVQNQQLEPKPGPRASEKNFSRQVEPPFETALLDLESVQCNLRTNTTTKYFVLTEAIPRQGTSDNSDLHEKPRGRKYAMRLLNFTPLLPLPTSEKDVLWVLPTTWKNRAKC